MAPAVNEAGAGSGKLIESTASVPAALQRTEPPICAALPQANEPAAAAEEADGDVDSSAALEPALGDEEEGAGELLQAHAAADSEAFDAVMKDRLREQGDRFEEMVAHEEDIRLGDEGWKERYYQVCALASDRAAWRSPSCVILTLISLRAAALWWWRCHTSWRWRGMHPLRESYNGIRPDH